MKARLPAQVINHATSCWLCAWAQRLFAPLELASIIVPLVSSHAMSVTSATLGIPNEVQQTFTLSRSEACMAQFSKDYSDKEIADILARWTSEARTRVWVPGTSAVELQGIQNTDGFWITIGPSRDGCRFRYLSGGSSGHGPVFQAHWDVPAGERPNPRGLGPVCRFAITDSIPPIADDEKQRLNPVVAEGIVAWSRMKHPDVMRPVVGVRTLGWGKK